MVFAVALRASCSNICYGTHTDYFGSCLRCLSHLLGVETGFNACQGKVFIVAIELVGEWAIWRWNIHIPRSQGVGKGGMLHCWPIHLWCLSHPQGTRSENAVGIVCHEDNYYLVVS